MKKSSPMLLWGYAPLVLAALLIVLVMLFAPSIAPEHYVPATADTVSTTTSTTTTSTTAPYTTTTAAGG